MSDDRFEAVFRVTTDRATAWRRLVEPERLPGFASRVTVDEAVEGERLRATKDEPPCAGNEIVVTLEDEATGTRIRVVQSRFGDGLPAPRDVMEIGWRFILADLRVALATGVAAGRHLLPWGDLGADASAADGGIRIGDVRAGGLAERAGLVAGDLLVSIAGAPVASLDDLVTVLRVVGDDTPTAAVVRDGALVRT